MEGSAATCCLTAPKRLFRKACWPANISAPAGVAMAGNLPWIGFSARALRERAASFQGTHPQSLLRGPLTGCVAGAEDAWVGSLIQSLRRWGAPSRGRRNYLAGAVFEDEGAVVEKKLTRRVVEIEAATLSRCVAVASQRPVAAIHFVGDAWNKGGRAGLGPNHVAVGVVGVMRIDENARFWREPPISLTSSRASWHIDHDG